MARNNKDFSLSTKIFISLLASAIGISFLANYSNQKKIGNSEISPNPESISTIKTVDNVQALIESRPQNLALIRCSSSENSVLPKKVDWSICGIIGDVPKYAERINLNRGVNSVSSGFIDEDGSWHDSQKWDLVFLDLKDKTFQFNSDKIVSELSKWHSINPNVRSINLQKNKQNSPILNRLNVFLDRKQETDSFNQLSWASSEAYLDRHVIEVQHGVPLFETNGEIIEIAALGSGQLPYTPMHVSAPQSLNEYNVIEQVYLYPESQCEGASRQALLIHEPHQQLSSETEFFFFLDYLQTQYPLTFGHLHIFQEGQPSQFHSSDLAFKIPSSGLDNKTILMLEESYNAWQDSFYEPLNKIEVNLPGRSIQAFLEKNNEPTGRSKGIWDEAVELYSFQSESGALDVRAALRNNFRSRTNQKIRSQEYLERLETLEIYDSAFAEHLIEESGFRATIPYELYVEGGASLNPDKAKSVSIYGLDEAGLYYASCTSQFA